MNKELVITQNAYGQIIGIDPTNGDVYAPPSDIIGMSGPFTWLGNLFRGGAKAATDAPQIGGSNIFDYSGGGGFINQTTQSRSVAAAKVGGGSGAWSKVGNIGGKVAQGIFNPNTAAGGLTQSFVNQWAANIAASGQYAAGGGFTPPADTGGLDKNTMLLIGGGLAAVLVLVIALK